MPFYQANQQRNIVRHAKNSRRQDTVVNEYVRSVQQKGIIRGVRGEAWLLAPSSELGAYEALTFGTLSDAFYIAMARDDHLMYPNLMHTAQYGLDALVLDHRTPDAILDFMSFGSGYVFCIFSFSISLVLIDYLLMLC